MEVVIIAITLISIIGLLYYICISSLKVDKELKQKRIKFYDTFIKLYSQK